MSVCLDWRLSCKALCGRSLLCLAGICGRRALGSCSWRGALVGDLPRSGGGGDEVQSNYGHRFDFWLNQKVSEEELLVAHHSVNGSCSPQKPIRRNHLRLRPLSRWAFLGIFGDFLVDTTGFTGFTTAFTTSHPAASPQGGELQGLQRLQNFLDQDLARYKETRNGLIGLRHLPGVRVWRVAIAFEIGRDCHWC